MTAPKAGRNAAIVAAVRGGMAQSRVARAFGLSPSRVSYILLAAGERLPRAVHAERLAVRARGMARDPALRAKRSASLARRWRDPVFRAGQAEAIRRATSGWPECPPHLLAEYRELRAYLPVAECRAILETRNG